MNPKRLNGRAKNGCRKNMEKKQQGIRCFGYVLRGISGAVYLNSPPNRMSTKYGIPLNFYKKWYIKDKGTESNSSDIPLINIIVAQ